MELIEGRPFISSDPNTKGFDLSAGTTWIYPINYQFREYQFNIAKNALFNNTLVCLPTGLGKTLIAAVVMFNFWRWYPRGKIVFLAPTKPLVAQQISACHDIMGIPSADTIELTGAMNPKNREIAWFTKRVIFATPQVFQNDLEKHIASGDLVRCVVIDEAHKALGKHSYCESLRILRTQNSCFRVLALSATPGSKIEDVCQVMKNLFISNLELRDETSPDIIPYINKRQMDIILVPLDKDLARFKEKYVSIMDRYVRLLVQYNVLKGDASTVSKGRIFYLYKEFQSKTNRPGNYGQIMKTMGRCMSLYHAYELMIRHGLRAFATFCESHSTDIWMTDEPALQSLIDEILSFLGPFPALRPLPDGSEEQVPEDLVFGHTKFQKLKNLLLEHFEKFAAKNEETRAIVFVEYRDSVNEVYVALLQLRPTLRPKMFVGQSGQKRKQQMQAMAAFRNNEANVLISTSVGEEGLDVGEVDLIVCFDISQSSPIRLVQRMGRTGRRRDGRIVMLVTDGKEHQALKSTIAKKDSLNKKVLHSSDIVSSLYQESPRMVPPDLNPECCKMHIVLQPKTPAAKGKRKRKQIEDEPQKESKKKPTAAKTQAALPKEVAKGNPTQSSMLQFLKKPSTSKESDPVLSLVSQLSQGIQPPTQIPQPECVKLFTSDSATIEFLTLCAIKASKLDSKVNESNRMDITYLKVSAHDEMDNSFDYPLPDLSILDCIASLEERTKCLSPEFDQDYDFEQIDNDPYVPEPNQHNTVGFRETNNSPAVGKFNYEDLFDDSCESDEMALLDDDQGTLKALPEHQKSPKFESNDKASLRNDHFKKSGNAGRLSDQVLDTKKQQFEEKNHYLNVGCFESILDCSSDSDIPPSQTERDLKENVKKHESTSPDNYLVSEKQNRVETEGRTKEPSTSFSIDAAIGKSQDEMYPLTKGTSKSLINNLHLGKIEDIRKPTPNMNISRMNKRGDVNKSFHSRDKRGFCLGNISDQSAKGNIDTDCNSRFISSKQNKRLDSSIGYDSKTDLTVARPMNAIRNKTNNGNESLNKYFEESIDEDDDVIFVGQISGNNRVNDNKEKSVDDTLIDDDEVVIEKEISYMERKNPEESNPDSSTCTITQILELIENSNPRKLNLSKISKASQKASTPKKSELVSASTASHQSTRPFQISKNKTPKEKIDRTDAHTIASYYFNKENGVTKNSDATSVTEELATDLDLSDIKWEDDFVNEKECAQGNKPSDSIDEQSSFKQSGINHFKSRLLNKKEESFKTNSDDSEFFLGSNMQVEKSTIDSRKTNESIKKLESFKTNSDDSEIVFRSNNRSEKPPLVQTLDFDLGDFEWDSDFETPANPAASLKQFRDSNNVSSPSKVKDITASKNSKSTQSTPISRFVSSTKKKLTTKKTEVPEPSTSKDFFDEDSDFEDCFYKRGGKTGRDHNPNVNYVLTTNKNPQITEKLNFLRQGKENAEPNSGLGNWNLSSINQKNGDLRKAPPSRGVSIAPREKVYSLDRDLHRKKKSDRRDRIRSEFLDYEAGVSSNTSSGTSGEDDDIDGFVSHTQQKPVTLDMHGHYLQSIKDMHIADAFHFKKPRAFVPDDEVFSQPMSGVDESAYVQDSFCVSGGEDDIFTATHEDSLLELAEKALNDKKRKRSKNGKASSIPKKRKLFVETFSDSNSSDDGTEELRKQILEESMNLREKRN